MWYKKIDNKVSMQNENDPNNNKINVTDMKLKSIINEPPMLMSEL